MSSALDSSQALFPTASLNKLNGEFSFHEAFHYTKNEIEGFLRNACTIHEGNASTLSVQERDDLRQLWNKILEPYFSPREASCICHRSKGSPKTCCYNKVVRLVKEDGKPVKPQKLSPIKIHLHDTEILIYSVHCALAAVLTITLTPPEKSSSQFHDHAYCLAVLLGKWCYTIVGQGTGSSITGMCPSTICVIYGTSASNFNKILWSCGTSRVKELHKDLRAEWRKQYETMVGNAIGMTFDKLSDSRPPLTIEESRSYINSLNLGPGDVESDEKKIHDIFNDRLGNIGKPLTEDKPAPAKFGLCAECVPVTLTAKGCATHSVAVSISLEPRFIIDEISGISEDNKIEFVDPKPGCISCQWLFAGLEVKRDIFIKDRLAPGENDTLLLLELEIGSQDSDMVDDSETEGGE